MCCGSERCFVVPNRTGSGCLARGEKTYGGHGGGASFARVISGLTEGGFVIASAQTDKFAAYLRMLKGRSGRGFDRLGKQAGISGSSLHRYCSGLSVPVDYRVVHSFAKVCGASAEELRELHRLWVLADAGKDAAAREEPAPDAVEPRRRLLTSRYAGLSLVAVAAVVSTLLWLFGDRPVRAGGRPR